MMHKYLVILLLCFSVAVGTTGCDVKNWWSDDVAGWEQLEQDLEGEDKARLGVFNAVAAYEPVQIVFEQLLTNPMLPSALRTSIKETDAQVVQAIRDYHNLVITLGPASDTTTAQLTLLVQVLQRAQLLLIEAQQTGFGG